MTEHTVVFPSTESLVGVFTRAEAPEAARRPAVVFLNAGMLHRIGPNRLHVKIARALAPRGVASFRFDLSGIGDSLSRRDGLPFRTAAVNDTRHAFDVVAASWGHSAFIPAGVCSGADLALRVALADARVTGLILIDGLPYRNARASLRRHAARLLRQDAWRKALTRVLRKRRASPAAAPAAGLGARDIPPRTEAEAGLRALTERGVHILAIYTEGREYAYRRQFAHLFPSVRRDRVEVAYLEGADHTFTLRANQERLLWTIDQWITRIC